jgi:hypothetical protein
MSSKIIRIAVLSLFSLVSWQCTKDKETDQNLLADNIGLSPNDQEEGTGCIQGVLFNGLTHARVPLTEELAKKIYVVTPKKTIMAKSLKSSIAGASADLEGEYAICGVPLGSNFPVYVKVTGFQDLHFQAAVSGAGSTRTVPLDSGSFTSKLFATPVTQQDIRLFPISELVGAQYSVTLTHNGAAVEGATVRMIPNGVSTRVASPVGTTATPDNNRSVALEVKTDSAGVAKFEASKLTFGSRYTVQAFHPKINDTTAGLNLNGFLTTDVVVGDSTASSPVVTGEITPFGVQMAFGKNTYSDNVLVTANTAADSNGNPIVSADGSISFLLNRPVDLLTSKDIDGLATMVVTAVNPIGGTCVAPVLATATAANGVSERFDLVISGSTIKITPKWADQAAFDTAKTACGTLKVAVVLDTSYFKAKDDTAIVVGTGAQASVDVWVKYQ